MKRKYVCTLFWLLLVFSAIGQPYPFSEIQKLFSRTHKLMYARELRLNDQHSRYYLTCFMYTYIRQREEVPDVMIIKEEAGQFTEVDYLWGVKERFSDLEVAWEEENGEMRQTVFFNSYEGSHFYQQLDAYKQKNCLVFIADIDADGNEEILSFGIDPFNYSSVARLYIRKYIQGEWKTVFNEPFFGIFIWNHNFAESLDNGPSAVYSDAFIKDWEKNKEEARADEWFTPKVFPYDFVEYKGKTGLRIIFYDRDNGRDPKRYYAQFWAYDEETQQYELVEDIYNEFEELTPADGLLFAEVRADLFWGSKTDFSKLNGRLTDEDLEDLDKVQLRIMRNAVYARHGRMFQSEDLQTLFNECSWYTKNPEYTDGLLTETDRYNISLIQKYEDKQAMLTFDYKTIKAVEPETVAVEEGGIYRAKENIYLRENEDTSGEIITTIQTDTLVKVLSLGKEDTIDGIKSNWVQIEVQTDGWDSDGNPIKAGTTGWCFGGNLKIGEYEESELFVSPETANKIGSKVKNIFRICVEEIQRFMERYFFYVFSIILAVPFIYNTIKLIQSIKARKKDTQDNVPVPSRILIYIGYFSTLVAISFYILQTMARPSCIYVIFETLFNIGLFDSILAYVIAGLVTIAGKIRKKKEAPGSLVLVITGEVAMIVVILFFFALNLIFVMEYYYKDAMIALVVLEVGTMLITAGVLRPKVNKKEKIQE